MSQFFVMKKYRGSGVGRKAAQHIFDQLGGRWEVGQMPANRPAFLFWERVISDYTNDTFDQYELNDDRWHGTLQCFGVPTGKV